MDAVRWRIVQSILAGACGLAVGCGANPGGEADAPPPANQWAAVREALVEEYFDAHPVFAVTAGRHEFDGRLPDWGSTGIEMEITRLKRAHSRAEAVVADGLSETARLEREILMARMTRDLFWLEAAEAPFHNPAWYLDWIVDGLDPAPYLTRNYAPIETRLRAYVKYAQSVQKAIPQIRSNLRAPLSRPLLERGVGAFRGFADFFEQDVPAVFNGVGDAARQEEFRTANAGAVRAMAELAEWLESQRGQA
ncbi:MAG: DUF885 family protein, partial [Vicinamibacterales bacterium]